jgi:hypothetical protein
MAGEQADYLSESRTALAILAALHRGDVKLATDTAQLIDNAETYVSALQALALTFLRAIDLSADCTGLTATALLGQLRTQFAESDSITFTP